MTTTLTERELAFTFPAAWQAERFDQPGVPLPKHIMPVDFVVERPDDILLIEVKDPSASRAPAKEQQEYLRKMASDQLTHEELVPKARSTWSYLHLMARTGKPLRYVVAIGTDRLSVQPPLLQNLTDKLRRRLAQEADVPWKVQFRQRLAATARPPRSRRIQHLTVGGPARACAQLIDPVTDRRERQPRRARHQFTSAWPERKCFRCRPLPAHPLAHRAFDLFPLLPDRFEFLHAGSVA